MRKSNVFVVDDWDAQMAPPQTPAEEKKQLLATAAFIRSKVKSATKHPQPKLKKPPSRISKEKIDRKTATPKSSSDASKNAARASRKPSSILDEQDEFDQAMAAKTPAELEAMMQATVRLARSRKLKELPSLPGTKPKHPSKSKGRMKSK